jgi:hypothetical protein
MFDELSGRAYVEKRRGESREEKRSEEACPVWVLLDVRVLRGAQYVQYAVCGVVWCGVYYVCCWRVLRAECSMCCGVLWCVLWCVLCVLLTCPTTIPSSPTLHPLLRPPLPPLLLPQVLAQQPH